MSEPSPSPGTHAPVDEPRRAPRYSERLVVPWWWWPPVLAVAALLAAEVHMGYPGVRSWLPYVIVLPLAAAVLVLLGRQKVEVDAPTGTGVATLRVGEARLPLDRAGRTDVVRGADKQQALGPDLDPTARVLHRPWVRAAVRIEVVDADPPAGAAPYWVVSTRHPDRLVEAIEAGSGYRAG